MSNPFVLLHVALTSSLHRSGRAARAHLAGRHDAGQATAEYALVVVGAAAVAFIFISWAVSGDGGARIGQLLNAVVDRVQSVVA